MQEWVAHHSTKPPDDPSTPASRTIPVQHLPAANVPVENDNCESKRTDCESKANDEEEFPSNNANCPSLTVINTNDELQENTTLQNDTRNTSNKSKDSAITQTKAGMLLNVGNCGDQSLSSPCVSDFNIFYSACGTPLTPDYPPESADGALTSPHTDNPDITAPDSLTESTTDFPSTFCDDDVTNQEDIATTVSHENQNSIDNGSLSNSVIINSDNNQSDDDACEDEVTEETLCAESVGLFMTSVSGETSTDSPQKFELGGVTEDDVARSKVLLDSCNYLDKFVSWSARLRPEERAQISARIRAKNDNIWEFLQSERKYLSLLLAMHDVYYLNYPVGFGPSDEMFPCLKELIPVHCDILEQLVERQMSNEYLLVEGLGQLLTELLGRTHYECLCHIYGKCLFSQSRMKERLIIFQRHPAFVDYLHRCRSHPALERKTLEDCYMIISQRWTKVETLLGSIIKNSVDDPAENSNLETAKSHIRQILHRAEAILGVHQNARQLRIFADSLEFRQNPQAEALRQELLKEGQEIIHHGKVKFEAKKEGKIKVIECHAVLLKECFFMLLEIPDQGSKHSVRFQLFKDESFPAILRFGDCYGYIRETQAAGKHAPTKFSFFVILEQPQPAMACLYCDTPDERNRWKNYLFEGFSRWRESKPDEAEQRFEQRHTFIREKWSRTRQFLDVLRNLDDCLMYDWDRRTLLFEALANGNSLEPCASTDQVAIDFSVENYLTNGESGSNFSIPEDLEYSLQVFQDALSRIKNPNLTNAPDGSSNLSRSSSSVEEPRRPARPLFRNCDSFNAYDSPQNEKRISLSGSDSMSTTTKPDKPKREYRRLSGNLMSIFRSRTHSPSLRASCSPLCTPQSAHHNNSFNYHQIQNSSSASSSCMETEEETMIETAAGNPSVQQPEPQVDSWESLPALHPIDVANKAARKICLGATLLHSRTVELQATIKRLEDEKLALSDRQSASSGSSGDQVGQACAASVESVSDLGGSLDLVGPAVGLKQENEKLRQKYAKFEREKIEWNKELKKSRAALERSKEDLTLAWEMLEKEKVQLIKKQRQYENNCVTLQEQIDLHSEQLGVDLEQAMTNSIISNSDPLQPNHQRAYSDDATPTDSSSITSPFYSVYPSVTLPRGKPPPRPGWNNNGNNNSTSSGGQENSSSIQKRFTQLIKGKDNGSPASSALNVDTQSKSVILNQTGHDKPKLNNFLAGSLDNLVAAVTRDKSDNNHNNSAANHGSRTASGNPLRRSFFGSTSHLSGLKTQRPQSDQQTPTNRKSPPKEAPLTRLGRAISMGSLFSSKKSASSTPFQATEEINESDSSDNPSSLNHRMSGRKAESLSNNPFVNNGGGNGAPPIPPNKPKLPKTPLLKGSKRIKHALLNKT